MSPRLVPPVFSPTLRCKLSTVSEALDYIDTRVPKHEQNHRLVAAAREALCHAKHAGPKSVASGALANALFVLEINRS
jgi:hypothetical protein